MFIAALTVITKLCKERKCPSTDEWIKKMWCVCTHTHEHTYAGILLGHQKELNLDISNIVGGARVYYAKKNTSEKDKKHIISLMWNLGNNR